MGTQLDLFADFLSKAAPMVEAPSSAPQLGLFDDRSLLLARAREAIAEGQVEAALGDLAAVRRRYPSDGPLLDRAALLEDLARKLGTIRSEPPRARAEATIDLARREALSRIGPEGARRLLRRAAIEAIEALGDAAIVRGAPSGTWLLEAGATTEARASLERAIAGERRSLFLARLADVALAEGLRDESRRLWLEALVLDPYEAAPELSRDEAIRDLPIAARYAHEITDEPVAWCAPVGIVAGVFFAPMLVESAWSVPAWPSAARLAPERAEALARARRFAELYRFAVSPRLAGPERTLDARREMKRLAPGLFAAFMESLGDRRAREPAAAGVS